MLRRVDEGERKGIRTLTDRLNALLYERAALAGVEFVSPAAAWDGHEPCGRNGQYTRAVKPVARLLNPVDGGTFHPNSKGQQQLARLVSCYLGEYSVRAPEYLVDRPPGALITPPDGEANCAAIVSR